MKYGESAIFDVTEMDKKGRGCGMIGGRKACAHFAAPGEKIEAVLVSRRHGVLNMRPEKVLSASPHRIIPRCPYVGRCGGCAWQQFDYEYQLELKRNLVNQAFAKSGVPAKIQRVIPCPEQFYYRNRMDYCVGPNGELGLKEPGRWNAYLDLDACFLLSPEAVRIMAAFRQYMKESGVAPWNGEEQTGLARYLVIREGKNTGKRMVTVVTARDDLPQKEKLVSALSPLATTIYHGINNRITDLSLADELTLLYGEPYLEEKMSDKTFFIHPNSFFQTNTLMAERLVGKVREFLSDEKPRALLDLYCGVGLFGISLADSAERVIGVESDDQAVKMAKKNAEANGARNAVFVSAAAETLIWDKEKPDAVIVDPPRSGLHPKVIETLLRRRPARIVYVSCSYERFAEEWKPFDFAYTISRIEALDLFPHAPHVELISLMKLKKRSSEN